MLEIYLLEQLDALKKQGTLRGAAEVLHMSQPSLTRSMQKIESILDTPILDRRGNRVALNPAGELVAAYAEKILAEEKQLFREVDALKRSRTALSIGSVAPGPLFVLLPHVTAACPERTISSHIAGEEELLRSLREGEDQIILLSHPVEEEGYFCEEYLTERLFFSIPPLHPASARESVTFAELDGQNFIVYSQIGSWNDIVKKQMPHSRFFEQSSMDAVAELTRYSELPTFVTDISLKALPERSARRMNIPFAGPDSSMTFYWICRKNERRQWKNLMQR